MTDSAVPMRISGKTKIVFILGDPVAHIRGTAFLNAHFARLGLDAAASPLHVSPADLGTVVAAMRKLRNVAGFGVTIPHKIEVLKHLDEPKWHESEETVAQLRAVVEPLAAYYFLKARTSKGRVIDPVARFHLGNGARLERIDWLGDLSPKGLRESAGIMVNYLYRLDDIEKNHEAYANQGTVAASSAVKKLLKNEGRRLLDMRLG